MKTALKNVIAVIAISASLAACNTSGVSTHANAIDHKVSAEPHISERGQFRFPKSDHTSLKGDQSKAFLSAGKEHFSNRNYGLAQENFRKAVEVRADNAAAWLGLAAAFDQLGQFDKADQAYKQLVTLKSGNARVLNNMGYSYLLRGDYQKARSYLNRAQAIDPSLEEVEGNIHLLEKVIST